VLDHALRAAGHLLRRAPREREQEDAPRIRAIDHELRDAVRERRRLPGARTGDHEQRSVTSMENGGLLLAVEGGMYLLHLSI